MCRVLGVGLSLTWRDNCPMVNIHVGSVEG